MLAVHSAAGFSGYAASDRMPERIASMVYVDTAPGKGALEPDFPDVDKPMDWDSIDGGGEPRADSPRSSSGRSASVRSQSLAALLRESVELTNDARRDIPSMFICTGFSAADYQRYAREHPEWAFLAGIPELRRHDLDRPAHEPLADVVAPGGPGAHHRRGGQRSGPVAEGGRDRTAVAPSRVAPHVPPCPGRCGCRASRTRGPR